MKENRIVFLPVPESLKGILAGDNGGVFSINPDIPIPVEIPEGREKISIEELSGEMILSGMLYVVQAGEEKQEWIDYYRGFVLALRPGIPGEFTEAAILKARNGDFGMALEILGTLRGLFPAASRPPALGLNWALVLEERAAQFLRHGKKEAAQAVRDAADAYSKLLELQPPFPPALFSGGHFFLSQNDYRRAGECFSLYCEIAEDRDKIQQARDILREIKDSGLDDESFKEAYDFIQQGKTQEGLRSIRDFLERYPLVWNGWFILGWALRLLGRWADGEAAFRKAIELDGGNSDTRNELAICLMETGDFPGARRELEIALGEDPENVKIISNLGMLAVKNGKPDEAAAFFRIVLELDGDDPVAKKYLEVGA